jgi:hypothetical protein
VKELVCNHRIIFPITILKYSWSCIESRVVTIRLILSANKMGFNESFISAGRAFTYNKKNNRPRIDPCGTPDLKNTVEIVCL